MNAFNACARGLVVSLLMASVEVIAGATEAAIQVREKITPVVDPFASAGKVAFFLILIVGLILLLAWLAGKTRVLQTARSSAQIKTLAIMPLGVKEKVAVVQVGKKQLVLGVTPHQVTCLTELDEPLQAAEEKTEQLPFSDLLKKAIRS